MQLDSYGRLTPISTEELIKGMDSKTKTTTRADLESSGTFHDHKSPASKLSALADKSGDNKKFFEEQIKPLIPMFVKEFEVKENQQYLEEMTGFLKELAEKREKYLAAKKDKGGSSKKEPAIPDLAGNLEKALKDSSGKDIWTNGRARALDHFMHEATTGHSLHVHDYTAQILLISIAKDVKHIGMMMAQASGDKISNSARDIVGDFEIKIPEQMKSDQKIDKAARGTREMGLRGIKGGGFSSTSGVPWWFDRRKIKPEMGTPAEAAASSELTVPDSRVVGDDGGAALSRADKKREKAKAREAAALAAGDAAMIDNGVVGDGGEALNEVQKKKETSTRKDRAAAKKRLRSDDSTYSLTESLRYNSSGLRQTRPQLISLGKEIAKSVKRGGLGKDPVVVENKLEMMTKAIVGMNDLSKSERRLVEKKLEELIKIQKDPTKGKKEFDAKVAELALLGERSSKIAEKKREKEVRDSRIKEIADKGRTFIEYAQMLAPSRAGIGTKFDPMAEAARVRDETHAWTQGIHEQMSQSFGMRGTMLDRGDHVGPGDQYRKATEGLKGFFEEANDLATGTISKGVLGGEAYSRGGGGYGSGTTLKGATGKEVGGMSSFDVTGQKTDKIQKVLLKNTQRGVTSLSRWVSLSRQGLQLGTMIGADAEHTAEELTDWHLQMGMTVDQTSQYSRDLQTVSKVTGVTGDKLLEAAKNGRSLADSMRSAGTLTSEAAKNLTQFSAAASRRGTDKIVQPLIDALSSTVNLFDSADPATFALAMRSAQIGGGPKLMTSLQAGTIPQDPKQMKAFAQGLRGVMMQMTGGRELNQIGPEELAQLNLAAKSAYGKQLKEMEMGADTFEEGSMSVAEKLEKIEATIKKGNLTGKELEDLNIQANALLATQHTEDTNNALRNLNSITAEMKGGKTFDQATKTVSDRINYVNPDTKLRENINPQQQLDKVIAGIEASANKLEGPRAEDQKQRLLARAAEFKERKTTIGSDPKQFGLLLKDMDDLIQANQVFEKQYQLDQSTFQLRNQERVQREFFEDEIRKDLLWMMAWSPPNASLANIAIGIAAGFAGMLEILIKILLAFVGFSILGKAIGALASVLGGLGSVIAPSALGSAAAFLGGPLLVAGVGGAVVVGVGQYLSSKSKKKEEEQWKDLGTEHSAVRDSFQPVIDAEKDPKRKALLEKKLQLELDVKAERKNLEVWKTRSDDPETMAQRTAERLANLFRRRERDYAVPNGQLEMDANVEKERNEAVMAIQARLDESIKELKAYKPDNRQAVKGLGSDTAQIFEVNANLNAEIAKRGQELNRAEQSAALEVVGVWSARSEQEKISARFYWRNWRKANNLAHRSHEDADVDYILFKQFITEQMAARRNDPSNPINVAQSSLNSAEQTHSDVVWGGGENIGNKLAEMMPAIDPKLQETLKRHLTHIGALRIDRGETWDKGQDVIDLFKKMKKELGGFEIETHVKEALPMLETASSHQKDLRTWESTLKAHQDKIRNYEDAIKNAINNPELLKSINEKWAKDEYQPLDELKRLIEGTKEMAAITQRSMAAITPAAAAPPVPPSSIIAPPTPPTPVVLPATPPVPGLIEMAPVPGAVVPPPSPPTPFIGLFDNLLPMIISQADKAKIEADKKTAEAAAAAKKAEGEGLSIFGMKLSDMVIKIKEANIESANINNAIIKGLSGIQMPLSPMPAYGTAPPGTPGQSYVMPLSNNAVPTPNQPTAPNAPSEPRNFVQKGFDWSKDVVIDTLAPAGFQKTLESLKSIEQQGSNQGNIPSLTSRPGEGGKISHGAMIDEMNAGERIVLAKKLNVSEENLKKMSTLDIYKRMSVAPDLSTEATKFRSKIEEKFIPKHEKIEHKDLWNKIDPKTQEYILQNAEMTKEEALSMPTEKFKSKIESFNPEGVMGQGEAGKKREKKVKELQADVRTITAPKPVPATDKNSIAVAGGTARETGTAKAGQIGSVATPTDRVSGKDILYFQNVNAIEDMLWSYRPDIDLLKSHEIAIKTYEDYRVLAKNGKVESDTLRKLLDTNLNAATGQFLGTTPTPPLAEGKGIAAPTTPGIVGPPAPLKISGNTYGIAPTPEVAPAPRAAGTPQPVIDDPAEQAFEKAASGAAMPPVPLPPEFKDELNLGKKSWTGEMGDNTRIFQMDQDEKKRKRQGYIGDLGTWMKTTGGAGGVDDTWSKWEDGKWGKSSLHSPDEQKKLKEAGKLKSEKPLEYYDINAASALGANPAGGGFEKKITDITKRIESPGDTTESGIDIEKIIKSMLTKSAYNLSPEELEEFIKKFENFDKMFTMPLAPTDIIPWLNEPEAKSVTEKEPETASSTKPGSVGDYAYTKEMTDVNAVEITGPLNDAVNHLTEIESNTRETAQETRNVRELMQKLVAAMTTPRSESRSNGIAPGDPSTDNRPGSPPNYYTWALDMTMSPNLGARRPNGVT